ncbi:hypothetical protein FRC17_004915 [Serendipita sp. 399]|nr:hypothetical protein FRC17_004915 [Serendipita sp. 399]
MPKSKDLLQDTPNVVIRTDRYDPADEVSAIFPEVTAQDLFQRSRPNISFQVTNMVMAKTIKSSQQSQVLKRMHQEEWSKLSEDEKDHWDKMADKFNENCRNMASTALKQRVAISKVQKLQFDMMKEFGFSTLCVVFTPPEGSKPAKARLFDPLRHDSMKKLRFTNWFIEEQGKAKTKRFLNHFGEYATQ